MKIFTFFANWGVLPFWLLLIIFSKPFDNEIFCSIYNCSINIKSAYGFIAYNIFLDGDIFGSFELYTD